MLYAKFYILYCDVWLFSVSSYALNHSSHSDDDSEFFTDDSEVMFDDDGDFDFFSDGDEEIDTNKNVLSYQGLSLNALRDVFNNEFIRKEDKDALAEYLGSFYRAAIRLEEIPNSTSSTSVLQEARRLSSEVKNQGQTLSNLLESEAFNLNTETIDTKNRIKEHIQGVNELLEENFCD